MSLADDPVALTDPVEAAYRILQLLSWLASGYARNESDQRWIPRDVLKREVESHREAAATKSSLRNLLSLGLVAWEDRTLLSG
jgi:hypothetical protein